MKKIFSQHGQGLIEAVFALGILIMVAAAILALTLSTLTGQKNSELQVRANNLARESIEVIRNIRDSNSLAGLPWDNGLTGGTSAITDFNVIANTWTINFSYTSNQLYQDSLGVYSHDNSGTRSIFRRHVNITSICLASSGEESFKDNCEITEEKIGLRLNSIVSWTEQGEARQINLESLLYAWK